jgi:hypothetical protein
MWSLQDFKIEIKMLSNHYLFNQILTLFLHERGKVLNEILY